MKKKTIVITFFCIMFGFTIYEIIIASNSNNYSKCFNLQPLAVITLILDVLIVFLFGCWIRDGYFKQICKCISIEYSCPFSSIILFEFFIFIFNVGTAFSLKIKCTNEYIAHYTSAYVLYTIHFILLFIPFFVLICKIIVLCFSPKETSGCPCKCDVCDYISSQTGVAFKHVINSISKCIENDENENENENDNGNVKNNTNITNITNDNYTLIHTNNIDDINITHDIENNINTNLQNMTECCVCVMKYKQKYVLVPCGHTHLCFSCYNKLQYKKCPLCNTKINSIVKLYE